MGVHFMGAVPGPRRRYPEERGADDEENEAAFNHVQRRASERAPSEAGDSNAEDDDDQDVDLTAKELLEAERGVGHGGGANAAIAVWLGLLIDACPESLVLGIMTNTSSQSTLITFVLGVFLANLPEAMSSSGTMKAYGMRTAVILVMWSSIMIATGLGAGIGAYLFPPGSETEPGTMRVIAGIEGMCGGAMLCMIANTVLPEAFEQGGDVVGLSCLFGFLSALLVGVAQ